MKTRHYVGAVTLGVLTGLATFGTASAHTAGARCDGPDAVFTGSLYGGADTHPRYILDGGTPVAFVGRFTKTLPNASTPHSMTVKADDWPDIHLTTPACVQPTTTTTTVAPTTTEAPPSTSTTAPTTTTEPAPPTTSGSTSSTAPSTPTTTSTTPSVTVDTTSPATTGSTPSTASVPPSTPNSVCGQASSTNSDNPNSVETSDDCGTNSSTTSPGPSTTTGGTLDETPVDQPSNSSTPSTLPTTGPSDDGTLALIALGALAGGAALLAAARRRGVS